VLSRDIVNQVLWPRATKASKHIFDYAAQRTWFTYPGIALAQFLLQRAADEIDKVFGMPGSNAT